MAADAELAVQSKSDMIIVNMHSVDSKNEPVQGSTPAVILLQGKTKANIDKTAGKKLTAGNYVMSVVSEGKTASHPLHDQVAFVRAKRFILRKPSELYLGESWRGFRVNVAA